MKTRADIPINRRWPGKWATRIALYRPDGTLWIKVETDLTEAEREHLYDIIVAAIGREESMGGEG